MKRADSDHEDERIAALLVAYEEALRQDTPAPHLDESVLTDASLAGRLRAAQECVELLHRVRRHPQDASSGIPFAINPLLAPASPREVPLPEVIGRFHIERELGRGGLGIVYLGQDPQLHRLVAVKVPRPEALREPSLRRRFLREAEAAARLAHRNLVTLYEVGEDQRGCYLATEYCAGPTLSQWLSEQTGPVPVRQAVRLVQALAEGVQHAHSRGVLHRDIKPSNILLDDAAQGSRREEILVPKLTDFGMARLAEQSSGETRAGTLIGTVSYMSPEQAEGRVDELDARTDVYALGAVLYELLCGAPPFHGRTELDTLRLILADEPRSLRRLRRDVPRDVEAIVLRCLARLPADRYATAHELAIDLKRFLAGEPTQARSLSAWGRTWKWARRRPAAATLICVSLLGAIALASVTARYNMRLQAALGETRQLLYASDMHTGFEAYEQGSYLAAKERLDRYSPADGDADLRTYPWQFLERLIEPDQRELYRHGAPVLTLTTSPDGRFVASASADREIRLWNLERANLAATFRGHTDDIYSLSFSPDGTLLASCSDDRTIRIVALDEAQSAKVLSGFTDGSVYGVAFSPDGGLLAAACEDSRVLLFDTRSWTVVRALQHHQLAVNAVKFSPDGQWLASSSPDGTVQWSSVATGEVIARGDSGVANDEERSLSALACSNDGRMTAAVNWMRRTIRLWHSNGGAWYADLKTGGAPANVISFGAGDRWLAAGLRNGKIRLWDLKSQRMTRTLLGHAADVRGLSWSPDASSLYSGGGDGVVKQWNVVSAAARETNRQPTGTVRSLFHQPDGSKLAYSDHRGGITVIDRSSLQPELRIQLQPAVDEPVWCFSPGGSRVGYADALGSVVRLVDVQQRSPDGVVQLGAQRVAALAFVNEDELVMTAGNGELARLPAKTSDASFSRHLAPPGTFFLAALDQGRQILAVGHHQVAIHDRQSLKRIATLPGSPRRLHRAAVSADGSMLIAGSVNGDIAVWDLGEGTLRGSLVGNDHRIEFMGFAPDGSAFFAGQSRSLHFWDARTLKLAGSFDFDAHSNSGSSIGAASIASDGSLAMGGSADLRTWPTTLSANPPQVDKRVTAIDMLRGGATSKHFEHFGDLVVDQLTPEQELLSVPAASQFWGARKVLVGEAGSGAIEIGRESVMESTQAILGHGPAAVGKVELQSGATWTLSERFDVGHEGRGELILGSNARLSCRDGVIANRPGSRGAATMTDGAQWNCLRRMYVGEDGTGYLEINAAQISSELSFVLGKTSGANGHVVARGAGALLSAATVIVGSRGSGNLLVADGAALECGTAHIGEYAGASGEVTIRGPQSRWTCHGALKLGDGANAGGTNVLLRVESGAQFSVAGLLEAQQKATISLADSTLDVGGLELSKGAQLSLQNATVHVAGHAKLKGKIRILCDELPQSKGPVQLRLISYESHSGQFDAIEAPSGTTLEAHYQDDGLDVVLNAAKN